MSVKLYDEALYNKIQSWIADPKLHILKPDETERMFMLRAEENGDKPLTLPLITISRDRNINLDIRTKRNLTYDGVKVGIGESSDNVAQVNVIPISINYQIDVWTQRYEESLEYIRQLAFKLINNPRLTIEIPYYDIKKEYNANLKMHPEIVDNSDISERLFPGEFSRWTLQLELQDAYLFNTTIKKSYKVESELNVQDDHNSNIEIEKI